MPVYPATLEIEYPEDGIDNWRPLVQWLLIIPYAIVAGVLVSLAGIVAFIGVFVILFTRDLARGDVQVDPDPVRWQFRGAYTSSWSSGIRRSSGRTEIRPLSAAVSAHALQKHAAA